VHLGRRQAIGALVVIDLVLAVLAWRDITQRSDSEVRVGKRFWRLVIIANPGNSIAYWLFGRKRPV
jgi:hypothetical protein